MPLFSVYPQHPQSQYSAQPNVGMYSTNNSMNLAVMASGGGSVNQMSSMNTEQVRL